MNGKPSLFPKTISPCWNCFHANFLRRLNLSSKFTFHALEKRICLISVGTSLEWRNQLLVTFFSRDNPFTSKRSTFNRIAQTEASEDTDFTITSKAENHCIYRKFCYNQPLPILYRVFLRIKAEVFKFISEVFSRLVLEGGLYSKKFGTSEKIPISQHRIISSNNPLPSYTKIFETLRKHCGNQKKLSLYSLHIQRIFSKKK